MRAKRLIPALFIVAVAVGGCQSCQSTSGSGAAKEDMQLVPKESDVVFMANLSRMRNTAMWRKLLDLRDQDVQSKKDYDEFVQKCGLDPMKQIDSAFVALPQTVDQSKEFAVILRGTFNEQKLVECAKDQAKKDNQELQLSDYNGHKLYTSAKSGQAYATFLDGKTVALGGKEWIKKVIDLATKKEPGQSAKDNADLNALLKRAKTGDAVWGAGLVPQATRDQLKGTPQLSAAGSMKDIFGSIDFASGFAADLNVDLGNAEDASELATKVKAQIDDAKKAPQLMMLGLNSILENVKIESKANTFHTSMNLNQQQFDDIITRIKGFLANLRGSLGGGMGGMPSPPTQ